MDVPGFGLIGTCVVKFDDDAPHVKSLKMKGGYAIVELVDGSQYKLTVSDGGRLPPLGPLRIIIQNINKMLIANKIFKKDDAAPIACRDLDGLMVNKTGLWYAETMYEHTDTTHGRQDTSALWAEMKRCAKVLAPAASAGPGAPAAGGAPAPAAGAGGAPAPAAGAAAPVAPPVVVPGSPGSPITKLQDIAPIDGVDRKLLKRIQRHIDDTCRDLRRQKDDHEFEFLSKDGHKLVLWSDLAEELLKPANVAETVKEFKDHDLMPADPEKQALIKHEIKRRYADTAFNACREGLNNTVDDTIRGTIDWQNADAHGIVSNAKTTFERPLGTLRDATFSAHVKTELLTPAPLGTCVGTRHAMLVAEERAKPVAKKSGWQLPKLSVPGLDSTAKAGRSIFSSIWGAVSPLVT